LQQDHSALIDVYLPRKILPIIAVNLGWGSEKKVWKRHITKFINEEVIDCRQAKYSDVAVA
jgi:hypothetical protein